MAVRIVISSIRENSYGYKNKKQIVQQETKSIFPSHKRGTVLRLKPFVVCLLIEDLKSANYISWDDYGKTVYSKIKFNIWGVLIRVKYNKIRFLQKYIKNIKYWD